MKNKKNLLIITALCCTLFMSACEKKQDDTGNVSRETTASKATEKSGGTTVIDVFSELNVTFEGENGSGEIICEYTGDNDFIKYDVEFKGDRNGKYKNGDTAVVKLDYSDYRAESANVFFKEKEKEYTVNGLWGVIQSADGYDFTECNKVLEERLFDKERPETTKYKINNLDIGNTFSTTYVDGESDPTEWKILSAEYDFVSAKLYVKNSKSPQNSYYRFYKVTLSAEKIKGSFVIDPDSKYAVGDTKEWNFVICEWTKNVFIEKDSNLVKINSEAFSNLNNDIFMSQTDIFGLTASNIEYTEDFDKYLDNITKALEFQDGEVYDVE